MLGRGARNDALGLIDDIRCTYPWCPVPPFGITESGGPLRSFHGWDILLFSISDLEGPMLIPKFKGRVQLKAWERRWFDKLGNEIMNTVVSEVDPQDQMALRLSCPESKDNRDERMMKLKEVMKAATTGYGYGDYPWDPVSLNSKMSAHFIGAVTAISGKVCRESFCSFSLFTY